MLIRTLYTPVSSDFMDKLTYELIETPSALSKASDAWKKASSIGIDIECENNLHHYGSYISIIQLSTGTQHWIVDVLKLKNIGPVLSLLTDPKVQKIFHDVGFDLRIIFHEFKVVPKNIFDTELAAQFLGKANIGLASLLQDYFGIEKKCKFQMADWTRRPFSREMLDYAIIDAVYLVKLRDILTAELEKKGRLSWIKEEFKHMEDKDWTFKEQEFLDLKGLRLINGKQRAILKRLFELRDALAKTTKKPTHFIISTKMMKDLAMDPPKSIKEWQSLKGVHPIVKIQAKRFQEAVNKGKAETIKLPENGAKKFSKIQKDQYQELTDLQARISDELGMPRGLVVNKEQIIDIVVNSSTASLRPWQLKLLEQQLDKDLTS